MRLVVLGGDRRYDVLTDEARAAGWPVLHAQPEDGPRPLAPWSEAPWEETLWLFPIPSCVRREGRWTVKGWNDPPAETFFSWVRAKDIVVYAAPDEGMAHMIEAGCEPARCANLLERHDFLYKNAMLTVEGALRMAADETGRAFWRSNCLVVGYGRIGKMLCAVLTLLGARVWASARRPEDLEAIAAASCQAVPTSQISRVAAIQDFVFNTVPAPVMDMKFIRRLTQDAFVLDLASAPYGADQGAMDEAGIRYRRAPGIPGTFYAQQAGEIILEELLTIVNG